MRTEKPQEKGQFVFEEHFIMSSDLCKVIGQEFEACKASLTKIIENVAVNNSCNKNILISVVRNNI